MKAQLNGTPITLDQAVKYMNDETTVDDQCQVIRDFLAQKFTAAIVRCRDNKTEQLLRELFEKCVKREVQHAHTDSGDSQSNVAEGNSSALAGSKGPSAA